MIDTRNKIVTMEQAKRVAEQEKAPVVTAYCDPLLPAPVKRLRAIAGEGRVMVVLKTPPNAYLDARARAELAASLDMVLGVVIAEEWQGAIALHEEEAHTRNAFIDYVRERAATGV